MENKTFVFLIFSTLLLSCLTIAQCKQTHALWHLSQKKLRNSNTPIDNSFFDPSKLHFDESRFDESQNGRKEEDKIHSLPGQPNVSFSQYGGYVTVDVYDGRALYYYFVEAQHSPKTSPLVLWLNGGPGCSSLGYGAMEEIGPFRVHSDGKTLYSNDYAWNQVANVLFLECPAGVGFSYSNRTKGNDTTGGDRQTAIDNYVFLANWLQRFSEYKNRDFYITGESYAGHYVPQLAQTIISQNKKMGSKNIINLKGIMIGNAVINDETDNKGQWEYLASHALITDDTANQILKYCDFRIYNPTFPDWKKSVKCNDTLNEVYHKEINGINLYSIYAPLCFDPTKKPKTTSLLEFDPCSDYYVWSYLNRRDVQKALHASVTKIPREWQFCSSLIYSWTDSPYTVLPILKDLMSNGTRVWIYSGDVDGVVPVTSTKLSIKVINLRTKGPWRPWYLLNEVGGFVQKFDKLTFVTVRGSGHEVPSYRPQSGLSLFKYFLDGIQLPSNSSSQKN